MRSFVCLSKYEYGEQTTPELPALGGTADDEDARERDRKSSAVERWNYTASEKAETHARTLTDDAHAQNLLCAESERAHVFSAAMMALSRGCARRRTQHSMRRTT